MLLLELLFCLLALLLLIPVTVFSLQVLVALWPAKQVRDSGMPQAGLLRPSIAVLVPAHNEAGGIAASLAAIRQQLQPGDRLLVVADNCSDDTAAVAARCGAEVIVRDDSMRRGKGYALDHGVRYLEALPPVVLVIVDADCLLHSTALDHLATECIEAQRPVQALYLMHAPPSAGIRTRIAEFAWTVKNRVRALGYQRLDLPCQLMGTGMAFPWTLIRQANLASGHIVEDLKLGLDLAEQGHAPLFCPAALVTSVFPSNPLGVDSQRTRWEHGHLGMILKEGPPRLAAGLRHKNWDLLALVLDMCVPPLALLVLLTAVLSLAGGVLWALTGDLLPWLLPAIGLLMLAVSVLLAWARYGRHILSLASLAYAPFYALAKIPLYLKFLVKRQMEWVRSRRD